MRVATIDIGTNSVLLLVAEQRGSALVPVLERATITRLGQGVDATRALAPEAVERTLACLASYADDLARAGVTALDAVGTSAMRDARGGEELRARAKALLGTEPRVISGLEEAELTFAGALSGLALDPERPVAVFDPGGGSTEIIFREGQGSALRALSLDIGGVRLTERHVRSDPPRPEELSAMQATVRAALDEASARLGKAPPGCVLVGVAGTVTTLAAYLRSVAPYDAARIHGAPIGANELSAALGRLAALPVSERKKIPEIDPARADVIVAGAVIVDEVLRWVAPEAGGLITSDRGVRWGLAERLAQRFTESPRGALR
jgi:exopolyphosphatase/guanosine-5'-triphosphate,3'-diphosphate pyrophosphatase